jgi:exodeoxyribonuclease V alpha subunit
MTYPHVDPENEVDDTSVAVLVATTCAACGRTLTDPLSVEIGMGPDCREKHGYTGGIGHCSNEVAAEANTIIHDLACGVGRGASYVAKRVACARLRTLGFDGVAARIEQRFRRRFQRMEPVAQHLSPGPLTALPTAPESIVPTTTTPTPAHPTWGSTAETSITGTITRYFFRSPTFSAGKLRRAFASTSRTDGPDFSDLDHSLDAANMVTFAGPVFADLDVQIILHGTWGEDPKYGQQFKVATFEVDQALDERGLARYLANNPAMRGIGPARARKIAATFGAAFTVTLRERPEQIAITAGMPLENVLALRDEWERTALVNVTATQLAAYELTHHQITALLERFGNGAATLIEQDPYLMLGHIEGMGFARVDEIARKTKIPKTHPGRIAAGIVYTVERAASLQGDGSTWVEWRDLVAKATAMLTLEEMNAREIVDAALTKIIREDEDPHVDASKQRLICVPVDNRLLVAVPWLYRAEMVVAASVAKGKVANPHAAKLPDITTDPADRYTVGLTEGQAAALLHAHDHSISLITGGAGTGKTFVIRRIVDMYESARLGVALCAPTGKAAKRIEQLVGREAKTIHRLLGCQGAGANAWPNIILECDVVIVDEMSMVSTHLAWRLLKSIDLARTAVVFVGDHNQLPPVESGNPLRDLIERRPLPTTMLDVVVRQAGALKVNSLAVLQARVEKSAPVETEKLNADGTKTPIVPPRSPWVLVERNGTPEDLAAYIVWLMENHVSERLGFDLLRDVQLLTPTHKGPLGDTALNVTLQRVLQKKLWGFTVPPPHGKRLYEFHPHDRVIHVKNNYDLGVMNGEVGTVVRTDDSTGEVVVDYPDLTGGEGASGDLARYSNRICHECGGKGRTDGGERCYSCDGKSRAPLAQIQLAYALTIHKYQGSEIACALIVCSKAHGWQHHRNLLYTGVTRARETAIIIGDPWGIRNCASKTKLDERNTWLRVLDL